jgi:hypothetical protein
MRRYLFVLAFLTVVIALSSASATAQELKVLGEGSYLSKLDTMKGDFTQAGTLLKPDSFSPGIAVQFGTKRIFGEFEYLKINANSPDNLTIYAGDSFENPKTGAIIKASPGQNLMTMTETKKSIDKAMAFTFNVNAMNRKRFAVYVGGGPVWNRMNTDIKRVYYTDPRIIAIDPNYYYSGTMQFAKSMKGVGIKAGAGLMVYPVKYFVVGFWGGYKDGGPAGQVMVGLRLKRGK